MDQLTGHPWERLDELLELTKDDAVEGGTVPESVALIFHDDGLDGMLLTPMFVIETADEITDVLCRVLPSLQARGIAVVWPAMFTDGDLEYWAMKVHRWDASQPDQVRTQVWPLPILDTPDGPPMDVDFPDPWSKRLAGALCDPGPMAALGVVDTSGLGPEYELLVAPGGALDAPVDHGMN